MPRTARQSRPGETSHAGSRGVDRQPIFLEEEDRRRFLALAAKLFREMGVLCFAWALMPNHYHFLLQPMRSALGDVMHRLNLMYAQYFNEKYDRTGHLLSNRYWNRLSGDDAGFRVRVRYIHVNPLRAGIVSSLDELETYPWTGHAALMGRAPTLILSRAEVLSRFADGVEEPLPEIRRYFEEGIREVRLDAPTIECAVSEASRIHGVLPAEVLTCARTPEITRARTLAAYLAIRRAGLSVRAAARGLGISAPGALKAVRRAEVLVEAGKLQIP
jgi:REP element-mobilizing transposase RayT